MADVAVTPVELAVNVVGADILDAGGTSISNASANVFAIAAGGVGGGRMLLKFLVDGSGDTIVILQGDRPPSQREGLGDLSLVLANSDVRQIVVETSRFLQDDGTIRATCGANATTCHATLLPDE